jgi:acetylornithine deacetylase/succinyl-diaminopimelate desuccinylase-like protein
MLDILAWAKRFVKTPSVSRDGNRAIAEVALELLREVGVPARSIPVELDGICHYTVVGDIGAPGDAGLLLLTHLDTVAPGPGEAWTCTAGDPWQPTLLDDRLYGLGTADAKVDMICKAAAICELDTAELRRPLRIVGSFAEEIGLLGVRWLIDSGHTRGFTEALVGEPSRLAAIWAHKGYSCFEARVPLSRLSTLKGVVREEVLQGESAHSSTPQLGHNAIEAAIARLRSPGLVGLASIEADGPLNKVPDRCALRVVVRGEGPDRATLLYDPQPLIAFQLAWQRMLNAAAEIKDACFDPDHTVGNLGRVTLRDGCALLGFDLRPVPAIDARELVEPLVEFAEIRCLRADPPLHTPEHTPLLQDILRVQRRLGLGSRIGTKATCTEAGLLSAAGLDSVVLGAGTSVGNVHRPNEYTSVSELLQARDLYREVIRARCIEVEPCSS